MLPFFCLTNEKSSEKEEANTAYTRCQAGVGQKNTLARYSRAIAKYPLGAYQNQFQAR